ncbi:MAG: aminotransferase class I/II-fold pyridoxal phosphate-dependent enzyme [Acidobacteriota bacterium]|nr:aminotransferase class I/II-fold pyridoxal phosphate-dependent enzyme [Acidobacteriota bacterium]
MLAHCTRVLAGLDIIPPFLGPKEIERRRGRPYKARLGLNECLFGFPPAALKVLVEHGHESALYNDPTHRELRDALASVWRRPPAHLVVAEGIEGLLGLFVRACVDVNDVAITSRGGYPSFDFYVQGCGGRLVHVPYLPSGSNNLEGLAAAARRSDAKLLYLANPDNPTAGVLPPSEIEALIERLPPGCLLLLDEAYAEFAAADCLLPSEASWPNLVRLRTFSKLYGLAGARVGYALADPALVEALDRIRQHFAVSKLSQEMALAALFDHAFVAEVLARTAEGREHYRALAEGIGITTLPSAANFVAFDFGDARHAKAVADWLEEHDVFVRRPTDEPLDRLIRITVGPPEARAYLAEVLLAAPARDEALPGTL